MADAYIVKIRLRLPTKPLRAYPPKASGQPEFPALDGARFPSKRRRRMRKFPVSRRLLTKLSIAIGIVVLSLGSTLVLTDPAPSTLPRRARTLLADSLARWTSPPRICRSVHWLTFR